MQKQTIIVLIAVVASLVIVCGINNDSFARQSVSHRYLLGYQMGCTDGPDQENYVGTGGLHGHSKEFTKGYNQSFSHGCTHDDPALQQEVDALISRHSHI